MIGGKTSCVLFVNCFKDTDKLKVIGQEKICQDIPIKRKTCRQPHSFIQIMYQKNKRDKVLVHATVSMNFETLC